MNLIRFAEPVTISFKKSAGGATITFEAGRDYVIANAQLERILHDENIKSRVYKISKLESRLTNFHVQARKVGTQRLLFFNGSGGYGDQIITWPVTKILSGMGFEVHVMTDPGNNVCWWNFPWIKTVNICPMPYEQFKLYDYQVIFEAVVNMDEHQDQEHPVDVMLRKIGIDPIAVAPQLKVVKPNFTYSEMMNTHQPQFKDKLLGMYQLSAANPVRCMQPADSVFMALKLADAFPNIHWLALYDEFVNPEYKKQLDEKIKELEITNIQPYCSPNLRDLWALTMRTMVVVSPDSMMAHIAGVMGVPCVGLWGPISPEKRIAYYSNHFPIYHREVCPHSPCFAYSNTFPRYCPPRPTARTTCEVIAAISPIEVIDAIKKVLSAAMPGRPIEELTTPRPVPAAVAPPAPAPEALPAPATEEAKPVEAEIVDVTPTPKA